MSKTIFEARFREAATSIAWEKGGYGSSTGAFRQLTGRKAMEKGPTLQGDQRDTRMARTPSVRKS